MDTAIVYQWHEDKLLKKLDGTSKPGTSVNTFATLYIHKIPGKQSIISGLFLEWIRRF